MKRALFAAALAALLCALAVGAEEPEAADFLEWSLSADLTFAPGVVTGDPRLYETLSTSLGCNYDFLSLVADFSMRNDQKYASQEDFMLGRYFVVNNGGLILDFGSIAFQAGRLVHDDVVDGPYSLFISSAPLPALMMGGCFRLGPFLYESRWVRLTNNAREVDWPDRGMNYKLFAFQTGDFRFGVQDSAVYVNRAFDVEYFLSPVPHIITQLVTSKPGRPQAESTNDNSIMGLFVEWRRPTTYACAQWLVDDINLDFIIPKFLRDEMGEQQIPQKMAWSIGGRHDFGFGTLGFYHAGATKYTFEPSSVSYQYGYTYYPDTAYTLASDQMVLEYVDNYVGYKYGENNVAFRAEYGRSLGPVDFGAALEYVVSGSKSIANPWHEFENVDAAGRNTKLLDDAVLEHTLTVTALASWPVRRWTLHASLTLGGVANELSPVPAGDGEGDIFRPQPGEHRFLYRCTMGARLDTGLRSPPGTR